MDWEEQKMSMVQCKNGHFYDSCRNAECPYCASSGSAGITRPLSGAPEAPAFPKTAPVLRTAASATAPAAHAAPQAISKTVPLYDPQADKTVALQVNDKGIDPVRGWLVCTGGEKKGKDFRIHSERNFIGRARSNDICLDFDESISREPNAVLTYDAHKNQFWLQTGDGKSNVYVNDAILLMPVALQPYDAITIGRTTLTFLPFCGERFQW